MTAVVDLVVVPGPISPTPSHGRGTVRLRGPGDIEADFQDFLVRARLVRCGDWHSHPWRDPVPSPRDLSAWAQHGDDLGRLPYAAVIVMPGQEAGWMTPEYLGWVIREDDNGVLVCEPAVVGQP